MENIEKVKEYIKKNYKPKYGAYSVERSRGNQNDVFEDGIFYGECFTLYEIGSMLGMDLQEPYEQYLDY
jgi:hypothetical protein